MPKKLNYNEVKKYIETNSKGDCVLLSKEYINDATPLTFQCKCGNLFQRTFNKVKLGRFLCKDCSLQKSNENKSFTINQVIKIIKSNGCEYISGDYKNQKSKLLIKCKCGNKFYKDLNHFMRGQNRCPQCGNIALRNSKTKYNLDDVIKIIAKDNYIVLDKKYINCNSPIKCKCENGHIFDLYFNEYLYRNRGCPQCSVIKYSGENHWNYKGGESEVIDYFRKQIKSWKTQVMIKYNNECYLTNSKKDCVVHHLISFNTIIQESLEELNLPLYRKINEYSKDDFLKLEKLILSKHTTDNGVLLQRKVHNKFHNLYGKGNNTKKQFNEFVEKYYPSKEKIA